MRVESFFNKHIPYLNWCYSKERSSDDLANCLSQTHRFRNFKFQKFRLNLGRYISIVAQARQAFYRPRELGYPAIQMRPLLHKSFQLLTSKFKGFKINIIHTDRLN